MRALTVLDERFEFCYLHKTLHHLREVNCKFRDEPDEDEPTCHAEEYTCIGVFDPRPVFERLLTVARTVIVSEYYYVGKDDDQEDSRGGMLDLAEVESIFGLANDYTLNAYSPRRIRPTNRVLDAAGRGASVPTLLSVQGSRLSPEFRSA